MRYIIVGNGVAGTKAAETIRRRDREGQIVLLSDEPYPFYRRPALVEHLAGHVSLEGLSGRPKGFYKDMGVELHLSNPVVGMNAQTQQVTLSDGQELHYDKLLLAVGLKRKQGVIPGDNLDGILTLYTLDDVGAFRDLPERARQAVVVGESVFGIEMARAFLQKGFSVTYLLKGARFWPEVLSPDASLLVEERLRSEGVKVRAGQRVTAFEGRDGKVRSVQTASGEEITAQVVGFAENYQVQVPWARDAGLHVESRLHVDENLKTNLPEVYAAGDAVRLSDEVLPFGWLRAWHQGVAAAVNMTGRGAPYRRRTVSLSTRAFGLPIMVIGNANPVGDKVRRKHGNYPMHGMHKELVLDDQQRVVGAVMVGDVGEASEVEALVRDQVSFHQVPQDLLRRLFDERYWSPAGSEVLCPVCKFLMHLGEAELEQGRITCPICGAEFALNKTGDRFVIVME
jgi:NAD(P)H-nitrite reductase large subunit